MGPRITVSEAVRALKQSFGSSSYFSRTQKMVFLGIDCLQELNEKEWAGWQGWPEAKKEEYRRVGLEMIFSAAVILALAHQQDQDDDDDTHPTYPLILAELYELVPDLYNEHDSGCKDELVDCEACNLKVLRALGKEIRGHRYPFKADLLREIFPNQMVMIKQLYALDAELNPRAFAAEQRLYQDFAKHNPVLVSALELIQEKGQELKERGFDEASEAAGLLKEDIELALYHYLKDLKAGEGASAALRYKLSCDLAIEKAATVLSVHRSWSHLLANVALALAGVVVIYIAATVVNKALTGHFTFFAETDSSAKLAQLKLALESQPTSSNSELGQEESKKSLTSSSRTPSINQNDLTPEMLKTHPFLGGGPRLRGSDTYSPDAALQGGTSSHSDPGILPQSPLLKSGFNN